jgi:hypothetical protein
MPVIGRRLVLSLGWEWERVTVPEAQKPQEWEVK